VLAKTAKVEMVIISLGSNVTSRWGNSDTTILQALTELEKLSVRIVRYSRIYRTQPYGLANQPDFTNAVALVQTSRTPAALLTLLKRIEAIAGRRSSRRWGPRPLDLDILDYNRRILNWSKGNKQVFKCGTQTLILPHPGVAMRPFVLKPLLDVAPYWHHPVSGLSAAQLMKRLAFAADGQILTSQEMSMQDAAAPS
jgi:2-amino-4-hydroxy-6-hydroxymethyldihydropteridine diphosphokinase